jgi:hypothetical protein
MTRSHAVHTITIVTGLLLVACTSNPSDPATASVAAGTPGLTANAWGPETPPFNFEAILRNDQGGFGLVKVRQPNDAELVFHIDPWVRGLAPNTSYRLQRAVDTNVNDVCTGTAWLTLGQGTTPQAIVTDERGTGRAALWRAVTSPIGTTFDVHFRVIEDATGAIVLESACYQFVITQ